MAESGCLHTSSLNTLDVSDGVICETFKGDNLFIPESTPTLDLSAFEGDGGEGDTLSLNESTDLPTGTNTFTVDIPWPKGSFIQDMSFMLTDKDGEQGDSSLTIAATDALFIKIDARKGEATGGIMSNKKIAGSSTSSAVTIWKNVPINFIQCSTGIIGDIDVAIEQMSAGIKHENTNFNDSFTILDPSSSWTTGTTDGYPLYNPTDTTNCRDNVRVTFTRAAKANAGGAAANFSGNELKLKLMVICTYMKVDLAEINDPS